ncbi:MAG: filamentous hemagglutinin N-terminal domain-containing protein, partial [Pseudomonadota bacterium]
MGKRNRTPGSVSTAVKGPLAPKQAFWKPVARKPGFGVGGIATLSGIGGLVLGAGVPAWAGPDGGVVTHGAAAIQRQGSITTITQATDRAALSWQSFDIGAGETVQFRQPSTSSIALNTILERKPTEIQGNLTANGQVWLQNPQGVLFGRDATVDVGGLLATTAHVDEAAFAEGRGRIEGSGGQGSIINRGDIAAGEGGVALIAPHVENAGTIAVTGGSAELAAATGFTVDTHGDGLLSVVVDAADAEALSLINEGTITSEGGVVRLTAAQAEGVRDSLVHVGGIVEATGIQEVGGEIVITGGSAEGGVALVTGQVTATKDDQGGAIAVNAAEIRLEQQAVVSVSAPEGGGLVEIGPRAAPMPPVRIAVSADASLTADATATDGVGDAGDILFWSTASTDFKGTASASAFGSGDGGFVDISSAGQLGFDGTVLTSAVSGTPGELLFDPDTIIVGTLTTNDGEIADGVVNAGDGAGVFYISAGALQTRINGNPGGTTTLAAYDSISLNEAFTVGDHTLNLQVGPGDMPSLTLNSTVTMGPYGVLNGNAVEVIFGATGYITFAGANFDTEVNLTASNTLSALNPGGVLGPIIGLPPATFGGDVTLSGTNGVGIYRAITNNNGDTTLAAGPAGPLVVGAPIQSFSPGGDMGGVRLEGDTVTLNAAVSSSQEVTIAATSQVTVNYDVTSSGAFDITIEELASGNTPNVTTTASFTSYTGDVLMPTVGTVSIIGGAMTGANVDITSDSTIEFRPATLDITGNLDLTSNTSTCICGLDGGDYDVDGNVVLDAGDAGSAITVEPLGGGNLPLDVGGDFTIAAGTGDVVVNPESLYVGTQAMGGGTLDIDGAAVTVTSAYVEGGIDIDGPAEITGSSVLLTSIGFYADSLDVDATTTTATVRSDSIYDFSVTGAVDIDGATGALFDAAGSGSVSIGGALTIDTAGGGGDTAAFDNSYSTSVTVGSLSVQAGVGNASIQGPVAIDTSTAASTVTLSGINQITLDGGISATSPDNPLDLSVSSRDVLVNATGGVGVVDEASIDGVFRNITLDANDDAAVAGSGNTLNLTGDLSIMGGASATEGAMLTGYVDAGGAVLLSGFNVQANPATLTVGTTLTLAGQTGASLTGTSYVSGLTTVSAPVGGGSGVDISPTRLDTLGLDVDAAGEINVDITRLESGTDGMLDGNVSLVSTGGAVYAGLGYTFSDVNGDLEISSPLAIDLDPRSLTVDGNLTLSSGTSVSISPFNGDGGVESSFISVGGTFTMQPTAGAGAVPITIDQAGGGAEINIYTVGDVALSSNGGDITIDADVDGDFQESTFGIGGDLTINAGAGSVRMGEFGDPSSLAIAGDLAVTGDDIDVFALIELVDEDGLSPATRSIDMNAGGDFVLALDEIAAGVPGRTGSITLLDAGTIDIDADGAVQIGGDLRGQSGSLTVVSVNAGTDLFTEANATIEGSEVSLTAGGDFAQATVDGSGVGLTIVTNGGAMVTEPALEITADNIEVFGTLNVIGDIELTATDPVLATILIGPQPAGVVTGTSFVQSAAPMGASGIVIATGDVTMNADTVTVDGLVNIAGELTATAPTAITVDDSVTAGLIRLDALDGLITLGAAADLDATDSPTLGVPHPLMMRAADFTIDTGANTDTEATLVGFTDAGESTASIGGTTGIITNDEYEVLGDGTDDLTVVANARDDFTGPTTLIIGDLDAPSGGDTSLSQLSFGASGEIQVTGEISGGGFSDEVRVGGWPIELGTREGVNGDTTNFVPDTIDVSGRIGVIDNGEGFDLEPPDGITFIANDDVITSTGLTDSSLIFFSAGTSVIDIGGDFLQENTTGAASPLDNGVPSAGSDFSALRIDNARRTEIFGTVNGVGGELA